MIRTTTAMVATLIVASFFTVPAHADVYVNDVDTITVNGTKVRLNGVDGPETSTRAGREARQWMIGYLQGKSIECELNGERSHDRMIGICYADGQDIGAAAIAAGQALDCRRYSGGRYRHLETSAGRNRIRRAGYCK